MSKVERPKRILKPNKRYTSEISKAIKKNVKSDSSKAAIQEAVKKMKSSKKGKTAEPSSKITATVTQKNDLKSLTGENEPTPAKKLKSLIEATEGKVTTLAQKSDVEGLTSNEARKDDQLKKKHFTCKEHKRKLKKPKKFTVDCSDVDFINVNDVVRIVGNLFYCST